MVWHLLMCDDELGSRVGEIVGIKPADVQGLDPLPSQTLSDEELRRREHLGNNGPRDVTGLVMTQNVRNERKIVTR
jgi:catalase